MWFFLWVLFDYLSFVKYLSWDLFCKKVGIFRLCEPYVAYAHTLKPFARSLWWFWPRLKLAKYPLICQNFLNKFFSIQNHQIFMQSWVTQRYQKNAHFVKTQKKCHWLTFLFEFGWHRRDRMKYSFKFYPSNDQLWSLIQSINSFQLTK